MKKEFFGKLKPGTIIRHKDSLRQFIITAIYGQRATAVSTVDITNPDEWEIVTKTPSFLIQATENNVEPGTQIVYIPNHLIKKMRNENGQIPTRDVRGMVNYPHGVQLGFIFTVRSEVAAACRYYYPNGELRTRANSEIAYFHNLFLYEHSAPRHIQAAMDVIKKEMG